MKVYEALASAFAAEGVDTVFGLMGDGNMNWMVSLTDHGVSLIHVRHENAAVAMADGYARSSGRVGVCSVTSGPGVTQIATSLYSSVIGRTPIVVFAGDTPMNSAFNIQDFDQRSFARALDVPFIGVRAVDRIGEQVQEAFFLARQRRLPVMISFPWDLQDEEYPWDLSYRPSDDLVPPRQRMAPDPDAVARAVDLLEGAQRPVIVAGAGAHSSDAGEALLGLGERIGALMATSLRGKGQFDGHPFDLGIAGAFASPMARELFVAADVVVGVGARMGHFTTEGGYLFPDATLIQVDIEPQGYVDGIRVADHYVRADARAGVQAIHAELDARGTTRVGYRSEEVSRLIAEDPGDDAVFEVEPGTIDPRSAVREIDAGLPKDWMLVIGAGHFWNFPVYEARGRAPDNYIMTYDFGVIGQGLPTAMGAALATPQRLVALIEGDGSIMMNLQVLDTQARHRVPVMSFIMNDGAYGAEVHKLNARGLRGDEASFGTPDLASVSSALGVEGHRVEKDGEIGPLIASFAANPRPMLVDIRVCPSILSVTYRRLYLGQG